MSNNYAGKIIYSKDITDLMCRANGLISQNASIGWEYTAPSGWWLTCTLALNNSIYFGIHNTSSGANEFKILRYTLQGTYIQEYSFSSGDFPDFPVATHKILGALSITADKNHSDIIWMLVFSSCYDSISEQGTYYYFYVLNTESGAISKKTLYTAGYSITGLNYSNINNAILGDIDSDVFFTSFLSEDGSNYCFLRHYRSSEYWVYIELATDTAIIFSEWAGNYFVVQKGGWPINRPQLWSDSGIYLNDVGLVNYPKGSNGKLFPFFLQKGQLNHSIDFDGNIILTIIPEITYIFEQYYKGYLLLRLSTTKKEYILPYSVMFEWHLYNATPARKESIGTAPTDDALCTTESDGVYTLPKAGYCTNLIEDLRTAIEDLVSWGVWKNPSTGNAYNWTDSDPDNAYHCAMASCYADYNLSAAGYDWARTIASLEGQPVVDLEVGEIDALLTLLEAADI